MMQGTLTGLLLKCALQVNPTFVCDVTDVCDALIFRLSSFRRSDPAAAAGRPGGDTRRPGRHHQGVLWGVQLRQRASAAQGSQEQVGNQTTAQNSKENHSF